MICVWRIEEEMKAVPNKNAGFIILFTSIMIYFYLYFLSIFIVFSCFIFYVSSSQVYIIHLILIPELSLTYYLWLLLIQYLSLWNWFSLSNPISCYSWTYILSSWHLLFIHMLYLSWAKSKPLRILDLTVELQVCRWLFHGHISLLVLTLDDS